MKLLVTGGRGQLARSVGARCKSAGIECVCLDREMMDVRDPSQVAAALSRYVPTIVINSAAYTAVDRAESDPARAFAINRDGAAIVARAAAERNVRLFHVSTDYVFDGRGATPYRETDPVSPINVYGASKAEGERLVRDAGGIVVRTSWLFALRGPGFVQTMLRLARERPTLRVVADQHGAPTWAEDLADALLQLSAQPDLADVYHYCGDGETTWHGFATSILAEARRHIALTCERIEAIGTEDYPTPARRPAYSVLDTSRIRTLGITPRPWQVGLAQVVANELKEQDVA